MKVLRLSALRTSRLYPLPSPRDIPGPHLRLRLSRPQGLTVAGRIKSMEILNDTIGNRTCDLPVLCLNQIRHRVYDLPKRHISYWYLHLSITCRYGRETQTYTSFEAAMAANKAL